TSSDCQGYSIEFFNNSTGGDSYLWDFGDGGTSTQTNPVHAYAAPGTYTIGLSVIDAVCQNSEGTAQVVVLDPPVLELELGPLAALCEGATVTILDAGAGFDTYTWSTGASTSTITASSVGTYSVTVTEGVCTGSASVQVIAQPVPPRAEDVITCPGQDALLTPPFPVNSILWSTGDTAATLLAGQAGDHWFVAVDTLGCTVRDTITVTLVNVAPSAATIPNVFSPNGDGKNDALDRKSTRLNSS